MSKGMDGFRDIFLAGVGSMAYAAEWGKDTFDMLVAKGESVVGRGRKLEGELHRDPSRPAQTSHGEPVERE